MERDTNKLPEPVEMSNDKTITETRSRIGVKPQDYVFYNLNGGSWQAKYEYRTTKSPEKHYGTGTTLYWTTHKTGWEAVQALTEYCQKENIPVQELGEEWRTYFERMDAHINYMLSKKGTMSESAWDMAYSCDAPNKPGYFRANND